VPSPQDDYHKLLTKYAEAENTIDQLRLGARVSLYTDPPWPSRSLTVGTVGTGCRVMTLSIPQARTAAFSMAPAPGPPSSPAPTPAPLDQGGSPRPPSPPPPRGGCPTCPGPCHCPGTQLTRTLAGQTHKLQAQASPGLGGCGGGLWWGAAAVGGCSRAGLSPFSPDQVESFEGWMQGSPAPQEQLQRFRKLKDAQDALERAYLRARQQHPGVSGDFDPDRVVEGEIFRLGLHLEELKEQLEPGARRQLPPQRPAQPRSPPAPSPPPATHSPRPEGPWGTAGDSEAVEGRLPQPLWHKQLRVEEDFGDLLAQYKHFKSLPESLSLEQLSLAGSRSQEEADGPAAGDGGPGKVPCRTPLEEGADLETSSSLHPPERRAALLPPGEPPWPGGTRGHLSPATAEEPPAAAKPPLGLPEPPRAPLSCRSSGVGSAATQHRPRKVRPLGLWVPICQHPQTLLGGCLALILSLMHLQEQRIVSPETDSGFVGSEASRVSPPVHTPEHRPPGTGTPSLLGPSILIPTTLHPPRKRDVTPLPSETALMGVYPKGGQGGTGGSHLPPRTPSQSSSPPRWAESTGSEAGPDGDGSLSSGGDTPTSHAADLGSPCAPSSPAHTDSEAEGRSCTSASGQPPTMARGPASPPPSPETPSPTLLSPNPPSLDPAHCDLLGSRLERDQAIRALRDEVWQLRRRLEESLRRSRSYPEGKAAPRAALARRQPVANGPSSPKDAAPSGEPSPPVQGRAAPRVGPTRRGRSASLPRDRPELDLSKWDPPGWGRRGQWGHAPPCMPLPLPQTERGAGGAAGPGGQGRSRWPWTRYQVGTPRTAPAPQEEPGTPGCPRCRGSRLPSAGSWVGDATRQPQHSTPRRTRCPTCRAPMGPPTPGSRDGATHAERGPGGTSPAGSRVGPRAEKPEQPGLWYLAASPGATAAIGCLAPVPLVPYAPSLL
ncbi:AKNA factor, partial [Fregetta grallaria]|nr:AKNA factor [Fregetta grallaria]